MQRQEYMEQLMYRAAQQKSLMDRVHNNNLLHKMEQDEARAKREEFERVRLETLADQRRLLVKLQPNDGAQIAAMDDTELERLIARMHLPREEVATAACAEMQSPHGSTQPSAPPLGSSPAQSAAVRLHYSPCRFRRLVLCHSKTACRVAGADDVIVLPQDDRTVVAEQAGIAALPRVHSQEEAVGVHVQDHALLHVASRRIARQKALCEIN